MKTETEVREFVESALAASDCSQYVAGMLSGMATVLEDDSLKRRALRLMHLPQVKVCRSSVVPLPRYQTPGAAGLDLATAEDFELAPGEWMLVPTGLRLEIPAGYEGQIRPRSGLAAKFGVAVLNAPGTVDSDFRGEVKVALINHGHLAFKAMRGDRIAQLVIAPVVRAELVEGELSATERGAGGFGSTGIGGDR